MGIASRTVCARAMKAALLVGKILFHIHVLLANQDKKFETCQVSKLLKRLARARFQSSMSSS